MGRKELDWTGVRVAAIEYEEVGEAIMVVVEWVGVVALAELPPPGRGAGMLLVSRLADEWEVRPQPIGKIVVARFQPVQHSWKKLMPVDRC